MGGSVIEGKSIASVAVIAQPGGGSDGGLEELRAVLAAEGVPDVLWYEVAHIRKAPQYARRALDEGADLIFVWGGDGTVQLCIHGLAGRQATVAVLPGGTGNILAHNLGIPQDLSQAVHVGLHGLRRLIDTGTVNGEHFAVMAGAGLDALMMRDADTAMKDRIGPAAYLLSGAGSIGAPRVIASVVADGRPFFRGEISMVLVGNVGKTLGGIMVFKDAEPDDGILELGVVTANSALDWARTMGRVAMGSPEESSFVEVTRGRRFEVRFAEPFLYEVDGNPRRAVKRLRIAVHPRSITLCVPEPIVPPALSSARPGE
jgi:diacylglycerol kinase (ATP)